METLKGNRRLAEITSITLDKEIVHFFSFTFSQNFPIDRVLYACIITCFLGKETPIICLLKANKVLLDTFGLDRINFSFIKINNPSSRLSD